MINYEYERLFVVEVVAITFPHNFTQLSTQLLHQHTLKPSIHATFHQFLPYNHSHSQLLLYYFTTTFILSFNYFTTTIKQHNFTLFTY